MLGIKETKEMLSLGLGFGNSLGKSLEDGKIGFNDLQHFINILYKIGPAVMGAGEILAELKDLDASEKAELMAYVENEFDIPQDKTEMYIEKGLMFAIQLLDLLKMFQKKDA